MATFPVTHTFASTGFALVRKLFGIPAGLQGNLGGGAAPELPTKATLERERTDERMKTPPVAAGATL